MSIVKSFSVGNGDMFYISHNSDNFTTIDCYLSEYTDDVKENVINEFKTKSNEKGITRFISTHPDDDHIGGLKYFEEKVGIYNFYCVANEATKSDETEDFKKYCELRDSSKAFYIQKDCSRRWMNLSDSERDEAGINIKWPITTNEYYKKALEQAKSGESPNNISPIITYRLKNGPIFMWMGDMETDFINNIKDDLDLPKIDILFAPHHGRDSGKIPSEILKNIEPKIIVIGEAPSEDLNYYEGYNTITQNSAGDIIFDCLENRANIYVSKEKYTVNFLDNENISDFDDEHHYLGTLNINK